MNKLKINWKAVPEALAVVGKYGKQHLPTIFVITGLGLSVYSKVLTAHESVKAQKAIDHEARERLDNGKEPLDRIGRAKIYLEYCWLSMLVESGGIALILAAHKINLGKIAAMTSLYQVSKNELRELKNKIVDEGGKASLKNLEREIRGENFNAEELQEGGIYETGKGNTLFIDKFTGASFHSSITFVNTAITELNTQLQEGTGYGENGYVELTDFLDLLGENSRNKKCGKYCAFRYNSPRDVIHPQQILDWHDYVDPTTGEPRVCFIDYADFLTPSDDFVERRPY